MRYVKDRTVLKKYSHDRSALAMTPRAVCFPKNEEEIQEALQEARNKGWHVIARGGGTGLSGAAIGDGLIIDLTKHMHTITAAGRLTVAQAGTLIKTLRRRVEQKGYMLPASPLYEESAIGGNVSTRSVGPRSVKYGSIDSQLTSCKVVLPDGRLINTAEELPKDIKEKLTLLKKQWKTLQNLKQRAPLAGGYNIHAFKHKDAKDILTHLLVGSTGTLGIITEVSLRLPKFKPLHVEMRFYKSYAEMQKALNTLKAAFIEFIDKSVLASWPRKYHRPCTGALILGFETKHKTPADAIPLTEKERKLLWRKRAQTLISLTHEAEQSGYALPSVLDDVTFHPRDFAKVMTDIDYYLKKRNIRYSAYGHAGIGSIHVRPVLKKDKRLWKSIAADVFRILQKHKGTLVGEHNVGLTKQHYLQQEPKLYNFMKSIKKTFDPKYLLNRRLYNTKYIKG